MRDSLVVADEDVKGLFVLPERRGVAAHALESLVGVGNEYESLCPSIRHADCIDQSVVLSAFMSGPVREWTE